MVQPALPSPTEAPPPAYEVAQLNFDQKLAVAAERSLNLSERRYEQSHGTSEEDSKGDLDEARQASAEPHPSALANGQQLYVRPLTFRKKSRKADGPRESARDKERPSWFGEAQLDASTSNSGASGRRALPVPREPQNHDDRPMRFVLPEDPDEDRSIPPPPFVAVDTSLDGPVYERYPGQDARQRRTDVSAIVLRYAGEDVGASPPPSPPNSPVVRHSSPSTNVRQRAMSPQVGSMMNNAYQHAPQQPRLQARTPVPRPTSTGPQHYVPPPPRLSFDPSVAYEGTKSSLFGQLPAEPDESGRDATSLYSSAVAPLISSQKYHLAAIPRVKRYAPSTSSLSEYDQNQIQQGVPSAKSLYSVQEYASSRASVYTQSSVNHIPQYSQGGQYPQMAQYPTQQTYTRPVSSIHQRDTQRWSTADTRYEPQYYHR